MAFDFVNWKEEVQKRDNEIVRLNHAIDKILEKLQNEADRWIDTYYQEKRNGCIDYHADGMADAFEHAIAIVREEVENE